MKQNATKGQFRSKHLVDALDTRSNTLLSAGIDDAQLSQDLSPEQRVAVDELMTIASLVNDVLVPVEPSEAFVAGLKADLYQKQRAMSQEPERIRAHDTYDDESKLAGSLGVLAAATIAAPVVGSLALFLARVARWGKNRHQTAAAV